VPILAADLSAYAPIGLLLLMAVVFAAANLLLTKAIGPRRDGSEKAIPYESGVNPIGAARKRFNVQFYLLAMIFLVFDVEVIFLFPWAVAYAGIEPGSPDAAVFLGRVLFFLFTTIVAYVYAYRKGVFRFE